MRVLGAVVGVSVRGSAAQRIACIATAQRGRVSRGQLLAAGISRSALTRLVAAGVLQPALRGVYTVGHTAEIAGGPETSALLAVRAGAALSHATALCWWGMTRARAGASVIHLTVPGPQGGDPPGVIVHRSTILTPRDLRLRHGMPVTSPARALLDEAPDVTARELERALDQGLVERVLRLRDVDELLGRCGRHHGRAALQALRDAHRTTTATRSEAEERLLALVRSAGLAAPLVNVSRHGYEIDFLWPDHGLAVEIDGFAYHGSRAAFERDRRRDAELAAAGIEVMRVTWRQLVDDPLGVIARLAGALARGRAH